MQEKIEPLITFKADSWDSLQASKALCLTLLTACNSEISYCSAPLPPEIAEDTDELRAAYERIQYAKRAIVELVMARRALEQEEERYEWSFVVQHLDPMGSTQAEPAGWYAFLYWHRRDITGERRSREYKSFGPYALREQAEAEKPHAMRGKKPYSST